MTSDNIEEVLVVGAGWTGRQIAAQCIAHGFKTFLCDRDMSILQQAEKWIANHLQSRVNEGTWNSQATTDWSSRLRIGDMAELANSSIDLAIECVPEQMALKRKVFRELSGLLDPNAIIASNSSYFTPSMLMKNITPSNRFAHLHFHAPIWIATIVDIVGHPGTDPNVLERLKQFAARIGQTPILEQVENPGYVFNHILQATLKASLELVDRKVASANEIEMVWKTVTGMRVGPFGMMDVIGLDLIHHILSNARWLGNHDEVQRLVDILQPYVDQGKLGMKTGSGFFDYPASLDTSPRS